ncbi:hypothetical protein LZ32DRAFT_346926 [Colletotrichum eremochloae]|nr:hypothetical protein LZ32DRAFT_346926 [Colletotrichum eremochloae]
MAPWKRKPERGRFLSQTQSQAEDAIRQTRRAGYKDCLGNGMGFACWVRECELRMEASGGGGRSEEGQPGPHSAARPNLELSHSVSGGGASPWSVVVSEPHTRLGGGWPGTGTDWLPEGRKWRRRLEASSSRNCRLPPPSTFVFGNLQKERRANCCLGPG